MSSPKDLLDSAVAEVGAAAVLTVLREGITHILSFGTDKQTSNLAEKVRGILGDKLQSEIEYQAAMEALRKHGP